LSAATVDWQVLPDAAAVAQAAAVEISAAAAAAIAARGCFRLVLAGGRTPVAAYRLLRATPQDWARWEIYFGDERCLPPDAAERNSQLALATWLRHVAVPAGQIHVIPAELGAEQAAARYAPIVAAAAPFDLVLLGIGEDGHTASLFPGRTLDPNAWTVAVYDAPKPPPQRVSLGLRALRASRATLLLATGAGKQAAITAWRAGAELPVAAACFGVPTRVLLDATASGQR
jgi:6-phosphogluconolactonase